jgi:hypothetical protein
VRRRSGRERRLVHLELRERRGGRVDDRAHATGCGGVEVSAVARKDGRMENGPRHGGGLRFENARAARTCEKDRAEWAEAPKARRGESRMAGHAGEYTAAAERGNRRSARAGERRRRCLAAGVT